MKKSLMICAALLFFMPTPSQAQPVAEPGGLYALCTQKNLAECPDLVAAFHEQFPIGQPGPYLMLKNSGGGYLAPDDRYTVDVAWELQSADGLLLSIKDSRKSKVELRKIGSQLVNTKNGDVYQLVKTEKELNPEAKPFRQTWEKSKREQRK
ncbi:MAG: hypothetical protein LBP33_05870 [Candidatus Adiutrix sp.]|nr:hypothetical protein [Candidatus Adiutrix sp.]